MEGPFFEGKSRISKVQTPLALQKESFPGEVGRNPTSWSQELNKCDNLIYEVGDSFGENHEIDMQLLRQFNPL